MSRWMIPCSCGVVERLGDLDADARHGLGVAAAGAGQVGRGGQDVRAGPMALAAPADRRRDRGGAAVGSPRSWRRRSDRAAGRPARIGRPRPASRAGCHGRSSSEPATSAAERPIGRREPVRPRGRAGRSRSPQPPHLLQDRVQRLARDELHDVVVGTALVADAEDRHDVGVVQPGRRPASRSNRRTCWGRSERRAGQDLQGHAAAERLLLGLVDDAHAAPADLAEDAVVAQPARRAVSARARPPASRSARPRSSRASSMSSRTGNSSWISSASSGYRATYSLSDGRSPRRSRVEELLGQDLDRVALVAVPDIIAPCRLHRLWSETRLRSHLANGSAGEAGVEDQGLGLAEEHEECEPVVFEHRRCRVCGLFGELASRSLQQGAGSIETTADLVGVAQAVMRQGQAELVELGDPADAGLEIPLELLDGPMVLAADEGQPQDVPDPGCLLPW